MHYIKIFIYIEKKSISLKVRVPLTIKNSTIQKKASYIYIYIIIYFPQKKL